MGDNMSNVQLTQDQLALLNGQANVEELSSNELFAVTGAGYSCTYKCGYR
jgi:hypothetical protein